jgi:hypothetical protein
VGRRNRQQGKLEIPVTEYRDGEGNVLRLRGAMSAGSRRQYNETISGGLDREDAWQRAGELLFEKLVVSWEVAGLEMARQKELLGRYRLASPAERAFIRESLRTHLSDNFPEMQAP